LFWKYIPPTIKNTQIDLKNLDSPPFKLVDFNGNSNMTILNFSPGTLIDYNGKIEIKVIDYYEN